MAMQRTPTITISSPVAHPLKPTFRLEDQGRVVTWVRLSLSALLISTVVGTLFPVPSYAATLAITELEDIDFGDVPPTADLVRQRIRACVNMTPAGPYTITGFGAGAGGAFQLHQPGTPSANLEFSVYVGNRGRRARQQLAPGVPSDSLMARLPRPNGRCRPPFLNIAVLIDATDLRTAPGGTYQGRLELTVAPE